VSASTFFKKRPNFVHIKEFGIMARHVPTHNTYLLKKFLAKTNTRRMKQCVVSSQDSKLETGHMACGYGYSRAG
jgi:hypothetical protein